MPIDINHPEYDEYAPQWERICMAIGGEDEIKGNLVESNAPVDLENPLKVIPQLSGQDLVAYAAYVRRAMFFPATGRTLEALIGFFEKPIIIKGKEYIEDYLKDLTSDHKDLEGLADDLIYNVSANSRCCMVIDTEPTGGKNFISIYDAESLVNWKVETREGREVLTMLVFEEEICEEKDKFDTTEETYRRCFELLEDNTVEVTLWKKRESMDAATKSHYELKETYKLTRRGIALKKIYAVICNRKSLGVCIERPSLIDLVNINMSHFRSSADLEHGRHYTALPTPWAAGFGVQKKLHIGSGTAWMAEDANARAGYLEFTGQGLRALETALEEKQKMMAVIGTRILEMDKLSAESEDTVRVRKAAENNLIDKQATTMSKALSLILSLYVEMMTGTAVEIEVKIARRQIDTSLNPQMLTALMGQVQSGLISWDTYFELLQKGQIIPVGRTKEEEKLLIEAGTPSGQGALHGDASGGGIATDSQNITRNSNPTRVMNRMGSNANKGKQ